MTCPVPSSPSPHRRPGSIVAVLAALALAPASAFAQAGPPPPPPGGGPAATLPPVPVPAGNPITAAKTVLGKILFWDEQLSSDHSVACGTCHAPTNGGSEPDPALHPGADGLFATPDDVLGSMGVMRMDPTLAYASDPTYGSSTQVTRRAAPMIFGSLWSPTMFWDGRAGPVFNDPVTGAVVLPNGGALETQALGPVTDDVEMAHEARDWAQVATSLLGAEPLGLARDLPSGLATAIAVDPTYPDLFEAAFGDPGITAARIGMAIATYERTQVPEDTPYDRFIAGDATALTANQQRGLQVFTGTTCDTCHRPPLFTDNTFRNIGLRPIAEDAGRFDITGNPADRGRFKTPSLRNVGLKTQFMHNGRMTSLEQVVDFYRQAPGVVQVRDNQDPLVPGIRINNADAAAVVDFLRNGLTDPRVAAGTFPFDAPSLHASVDACADGLDNDGDGLSDMADPGCADLSDRTETAFDDACDDGLDNDGDGLADLADTDCDSGCVGDLDGDGTCDADDLVLDISTVRPGDPMTLTATGAMPGSVVTFMVTARGEGDGPCHPTLPACADLLAPIVLGTVPAPTDASVVLDLTVPAGINAGRTLHFQAVWLDTAAHDAETSNVVARVVQP